MKEEFNIKDKTGIKDDTEISTKAAISRDGGTTFISPGSGAISSVGPYDLFVK